MSKLVKIAEYGEDEIGAQMAKQTLEQEGVFCAISGAELRTMLPYLHGATIELWVNEEDAPRAREILADIESQPQSEAGGELE